MPIKLIVSNRFKELMRRNFRPEELALIEASKDNVTTSIFAVHQVISLSHLFSITCVLCVLFFSSNSESNATSTYS